MDRAYFTQLLANTTQLNTHQVLNLWPVGGGCINDCYRLKTQGSLLFVKLNAASQLRMFEQEAIALDHLRQTIRTPQVLEVGRHQNHSYLVMEWVETTRPTQDFWRQLGEQLAILHQISHTHFGYFADNYIGSLPQSNRQHQSWHAFFIEERLRPQLKLASSKNLTTSQIQAQFDQLFAKWAELIPPCKPALLHGDLWSGNFLCDTQQQPWLVDPAVYFGHPETELAFTAMFGGFDQLFYQTYQNHHPLEAGFKDRIALHNLYPTLVHLNLFGTSYLSAIKQTLDKFI